MTAQAQAPALIDQVIALKAQIDAGKISDRNWEFANSLVSAYKRYGRLSEKQAAWVAKLVSPAPRPAQTIEASRLIAMFDSAAQNLKRPKIKIELAGTEIVLKQATKGAEPGSVFVVAAASDTYLGRISRDGGLNLREAPGVSKIALAQALADFAKAPEATAAAYGKRFGVCCFCSRELTDQRSVDAGYGPVCAERFSLDWG